MTNSPPYNPPLNIEHTNYYFSYFSNKARLKDAVTGVTKSLQSVTGRNKKGLSVTTQAWGVTSVTI